MKHFLSFSGINTKVKAMGAKLISPEEFKTIANLEAVSDLIAFLKNHPGYREIFERYDEHELHRADAERIISVGLYLDYAKLYRFANDMQRKDLELFFFRYEVTILKNCIHNIYSSNRSFDLSLFEAFFNKHSDLNVTALAASQSMDEYINHLRGTQYYPLLVKLQNSGNVTTFDYEMHLDIYFFKKTWKLKDRELEDQSHKAFTHRLGTEIDLLNIMWVFRSKSMYHMPSSDIYSFIIPVNYRLTKEQLHRLVESATLDEFMNILKTTHYNSFAGSLHDGTMEHVYRNIITKIYRNNKINYPSSMATVNNYIHEKEAEINRLTTALECIRYGLDPQVKLKYILQ
ncbi:V-type ATPase subunit [Mobilitalea sibirica]|uniref:V-type ATPase subunit n=1 Tax=Mobilitalea sibirica TaxID=1462919 RepID=A0A8J7H561_9FIRM|nr:V-type ATPase subunit [Mobilitalea sibirica]MBH1942347.1 V-type ATPase subunit [Mobilitalea sibirica]